MHGLKVTHLLLHAMHSGFDFVGTFASQRLDAVSFYIKLQILFLTITIMKYNSMSLS